MRSRVSWRRLDADGFRIASEPHMMWSAIEAWREIAGGIVTGLSFQAFMGHAEPENG